MVSVQAERSLLSIMLFFIVAFRSAKEWKNATFAERKATLICRTMLSDCALGLLAECFRWCDRVATRMHCNLLQVSNSILV